VTSSTIATRAQRGGLSVRHTGLADRSMQPACPNALNAHAATHGGLAGPIAFQQPRPASRGWGSNVQPLAASNENRTDEQRKSWVTKIEFTLATNRIMLISAKLLRDYQRTRISLLSGIFGVLSLFMITTNSFSAINYGYSGSNAS
jgi:hypothetical protein